MENASTAYVSKVVRFTERIALAPFYFSKNLKKIEKMQCAIRAVKQMVSVKKGPQKGERGIKFLEILVPPQRHFWSFGATSAPFSKKR